MATPDRPTPSRSPSEDLAHLTGRSHLPRELESASGMQKLDWILGQPDPQGFIQALAPQELYYWMRDIGKGDALPLLEMADREQKRALVDIDAWSRHELLLPRWLEWLDLAHAAGDDTALDFIAAQDDETLEWLFTGDVTVHPADHDLDTVPDELAAFHTPDGMYLLTVPRDHELEERLPRLLKFLYASDEDRARLVLQQVQFELRSNITEQMERFRDARIQDLGFEPMDEALALYTTLPVAALRDEVRRGASVDDMPPGAVATGLARDLVLRDVPAPELLGEALAALAPDVRARVGEGLAYVVNKVFVADTGDLSRVDDLPIAGRYASGLVNLGLEHLSDDSLEVATRVLATTSPQTLFRAGYTLTLELAQRARKVRARAGAGTALFGSPSDEVLDGLAMPRPLCFEGLDEPGRLGYRPFRTLADLAAAEVRVADAAALLSFFEARFGYEPKALAGLPLSDEARASVRLGTLFRTAVARVVLEDAASFTPLAKDDLVAFARAAFVRGPTGTSWSPPLARLVADVRAAGANEAVVSFVDRALDELLEAVGSVRPDELEPRYTGDLFLVQGE